MIAPIAVFGGLALVSFGLGAELIRFNHRTDRDWVGYALGVFTIGMGGLFALPLVAILSESSQL